MTTTADTLRAARALIESPADWRQYSGVNHHTTQGYCAMEALSGVPTAVDGAYDQAAEGLHAQLPADVPSIITYNDDPSTTHADILALFDRAIAAQEV